MSKAGKVLWEPLQTIRSCDDQTVESVYHLRVERNSDVGGS